MNDAAALLVVLILIGLYFVPTFISFKRDHDNKVSIMVLNIFFGWTFFGWVGTLAWSLTSQK